MKSIVILVLLLTSFGFSQQHHILQLKDEEQNPVPVAFVSFEYLGGEHIHEQYTVLSDSLGEVIFPYEDEVFIQVKASSFSDTAVICDGKHHLRLSLHHHIYRLDEAIITTTHCKASIEKAVHKVRVIDAKMIEQRGATNLKDVLATEMNIRIEQDNILGTGMTMQGLSGENVKILVDGVPLIGRLNGNIDLSQINLDNIERIEIVEGPLSVIYGSNALAGTINLVSKKPKKSNLQLTLQSFYESVGQYNLSGQLSKQIKKSGLALHFGRNYFDGYSTNDTSRNQIWKPKEQYFATTQFNFSDKNFRLRLSNEFFREELINKGAARAPYYSSAFDDYYFTTRNNTSIFIKWIIKDNWFYSSTINYSFYQREKQNYFKDLTSLEQNLTSQENQDLSTFDLFLCRGTLSHQQDSSRLYYTIGYDLNYESTIGKRIENQQQGIGDYALFISAEYKIHEKITLKSGLRYAYNTLYQSPLIPSVNLLYHFHEKITFRLSYGRGFRAPSLKELYFNFVDLNHDIHGNPNLQAETSDAFQLHIDIQDSIGDIKVKSDFSCYYNALKNKIDLLQTDENGLYKYINILEFRSTGIQINNSFLWKSWNWNIGFNYSGRNDFSLSHQRNHFLFSPEIQSTVTKEFKPQNLSFSIIYKYTGKSLFYYEGEDEEVKQGTVAAYSIVNLTCQKRIWKDRLTINTGIKNLMNITQVAVSGRSSGVHSSSNTSTSMAWGRSFYLGLKLIL